MHPWLLYLSFILILPTLQAQDTSLLLPQLGYGAHFEQQLIIEVPTGTKELKVLYHPIEDPSLQQVTTTMGPFGKPYHFVKITLAPLQMNTTYSYQVYLDGQQTPSSAGQQFTTRKLWEWREDAPAVSFLFGSCHYSNDEPYDRPGRPYGRGNDVIREMVADTADFNLWAGDNIYLREVDWSSETGIYYRYHHFREDPYVQRLLHMRPNFATWDDHDFGPNNSNRAFQFKEEALAAFKSNWANPKFGLPGVPGVFGEFEWSDCDFFLLDNRYYRSPEWYADSVNGDWNPDKAYLGKRQLQWIKDALANSRASFKFIVSGSQVLNTAGGGECFCNYREEWSELLGFIRDNDIRGVVFLSGDRHMSEVLKVESNDMYPLYEFTSSPISAGPFSSIEERDEFNNPLRVEGTLYPDLNYMKMTVTGERRNRVLTVELKDKAGQVVWTQQVNQQDLRLPAE